MPAREYSDDERRAREREYQRRYREKNREKINAQKRQWREDNRERAREHSRNWWRKQPEEYKRAHYEDHRDEIIQRATEWNRANPERRSQITRKHATQPEVKQRRADQTRAWALANPDKIHAYSLLYSGWRRGAGAHTPEANEYIGIIRNDPCSYCGEVAGEGDHIVAVACGGTNDWDNFTAACRSCNAGKRENSLLFYLLRKG